MASFAGFFNYPKVGTRQANDLVAFILTTWASTYLNPWNPKSPCKHCGSNPRPPGT